MFSLGNAETQNSILKFSECITVVKYVIKIVQNTAGMHIVMVSSICGAAYKNVTSGTCKGIQEVYTVKRSLWNEIPTVRMAWKHISTGYSSIDTL